MIKKVFALIALGVMLSGCFMAPLAFIGPASSGFTTSSIIQSGFTSSANYIVKKSTGKTIAEHAFESVSKDYLKQTYLPNRNVEKKFQESKSASEGKEVSKRIILQSFLSN